jgi:phosphopantothenoylcysteine decarboxylase/phosphopantothenate--cysteine ligase
MTEKLQSPDLTNRAFLLIISGGIAAYKSLELIRLLRKSGAHVRCILTQGGAEFVTPLSISALSENPVYTDLWSLKDESEMGHIRLSREADAIIIAPASANMIAKISHGLADDLASTCVLASDKPVIIAPAMNHRMWSNAATQDNLKILKARGMTILEPTEGEMACGEYGIGRMREPEEIVHALHSFFFTQPLKGLKALVTAGPTYEPIDPVRFIGNRSSGKQGIAIARALQMAGADVTLIMGPVETGLQTNTYGSGSLTIKKTQTAQEMLSACIATLPVEIAVCAAAVSDWRPSDVQLHKMKKRNDQSPPAIELSENPDILKILSHHAQRPRLVVGFAAETENLLANASQKRVNKGCDWIIANTVSENSFGSDENEVTLITASSAIHWPRAPKTDIAHKIVQHITEYFQ